MRSDGALIATLLIALVGVYLYLTRGSRAINSIVQQGYRNASTMPVYEQLLPGSVPDIPTPFNWGGFTPGDFLVTQDVNS